MTDAAGKPVRKPPRKVSEAYLQRAAMSYLERYASSAENLRRVLRRKVDKRCRLRGEDPAEFHDMIDDVVAKSLKIGLIDDTRYAEARVATLRRRGGSARAIQAKLSAKGVDRSTIAAARAFARRRKLGPFRPGERAPYRDKDLAAMARAGFRFDVARSIVEGERDEDEA
jgi:regulatory protein